ncbi:MAG: hypothetical protein OK422_03080 [Thaumarchaeota archaeon]|nr:hypothetical protein [Nitrososphaerota archaeon]
MGRTIPSFRLALEAEISSWGSFRKSLNPGARRILDKLFNEARTYCSASSNAARPVRFEGMLMAIIFAQARRVEDIARGIEETRLELDDVR